MLFLKNYFLYPHQYENSRGNRVWQGVFKPPGKTSLSFSFSDSCFLFALKNFFLIAKQCKYAKCDWDKEKPLVVDKKSLRRKSDAEEGHFKFTRGCD